MKFGYAILYVQSVAGTVAFYEAAFGLEPGMVVPTGEYGEMQTGTTRLAFAATEFVRTQIPAAFEAAAPEKRAPPVELGLVTDEVVAAFDRAVAAGAVPVKPPERKPWGQLVGYVRDNNRFLVELCSPLPACGDGATEMTGDLDASTIRATTAADLPGLKRVIDATGLFPSSMLDEMTAGHVQGDTASEIWLTDDAGGPIGLAYCAPERMTVGTWNLYLIAVHPDHHGRGHGGRLLRSIEAEVAGRGARVLLVETSGLASFSRTRAFYARNGYQEEARIREFYAAGEDKVIFRKSLAPFIRTARRDEVAAMQALELDAARRYGTLEQTAFVLEMTARSDDEHDDVRRTGIALVCEKGGIPVGFVLALPRDGRAHILEIAVAQDHHGAGVGTALLAAVEEWARAAGYTETTLSTFRDVPWNAPFYGRRGYEIFEVGADRAELLGLLATERQEHIDRAPRVAMRKRL